MAGSGSNPNPEWERFFASLFRSETTEARPPYILIVEDNRADVFLIREAMATAHVDAQTVVADDGEKAVLFFENLGDDPSLPCPDLIILDINLPKRHGAEVFKEVRARGRCGDTPVLVVTSSDSARDREEMARLGSKGYFRKPSDYTEFMKLGSVIKDLLARKDS